MNSSVTSKFSFAISALLCVVSLYFLNACNSMPNGNAGGGPAKEELIELNDYSDCSGAEIKTGDLYKSWQKNYFSTNGITYNIILKLTTSTVEFSQTCKKDTASVTAKTRSPIQIVDQNINILKADYNNETATINGVSIDCEAEINNETVQFSFIGSCLKLKYSNDETQLFLPL